jgi:hypothetical protein
MANFIASPKSTLNYQANQANQANQSSLKGEGLIECKAFKQRLGLISLQFRSSLNQAPVFSLIVDKSGRIEAHATTCANRSWFDGQSEMDRLAGEPSMPDIDVYGEVS